MKTAELTGAALDWAVSMVVENSRRFPIWLDGKPQSYAAYSTDWAQGGPIIEREKLLLTYAPDGGDDPDQPWVCDDYAGEVCSGMYWGSTPLIAAMRCYVASKLGDDIEIPKELMQ